MTTHNNFNDQQMAILARASVSRPQDLPTPEEKLHFANTATFAKPGEPVNELRLNLDSRRMEEEGVQPTSRIELQHKIDSVSQGRFERATNCSTRSMTDAEYVASMRAVLPFADEDSAVIITRMLPHYIKADN
ncbi:hypothetical protein [Mesorhizobium sp.]|uniref:hypothetical protein n=1 Tax=Mesorhizobium sp. TaxID=1871066 RepID=UPI00260155C1|nr:hypothetical protein [Mesorhizobium sp.]